MVVVICLFIVIIVHLFYKCFTKRFEGSLNSDFFYTR